MASKALDQSSLIWQGLGLLFQTTSQGRWRGGVLRAAGFSKEHRRTEVGPHSIE